MAVDGSSAPARPTRSRRIAALVLAIGLTTGAVGFGLWRVIERRMTHTFTDRQFGWTMRYPGSYRLGTFSSGGLFESDGVWVANFDAHVTGTCCPIPNMTAFRTFPGAGVAFLLWFGQRLPVPPPRADSTFPLTLGRFQKVQPYVGGAEPHPRFLSFAADGTYFAAAAWFGPSVSRADRDRIGAVVTSIRFPHIRTSGWTTDHRYWALGSASSYPLGSITRFVIPRYQAGRPVGYYVGLAPDGFAVVQQRYFEGALTCSVVVQAGGYACPDAGLAWNADGGLTRGQGGLTAKDLPCRRLTVAFDGTVLFAPFYGSPSGLGWHACGTTG